MTEFVNLRMKKEDYQKIERIILLLECLGWEEDASCDDETVEEIHHLRRIVVTTLAHNLGRSNND